MNDSSFCLREQPKTAFLGLAPFLRMSVRGESLLPIGQEMLAQARLDAEDAELWMNLSVAMQCIRERDIGLSIQGAALEQKRIYYRDAAIRPAALRVVLLMAPGDIAENTPLDCLLDNSDIELIFYYITPGNPLALPVPEHDVLMVAMSDSDRNRIFLSALNEALANWPKPVINAPQHIPATGRNTASRLLQDAPGILIPPTLRVARAELQAVASGSLPLAKAYPGCDFPVIVRPLDSQAGRDLDRIARPEELAAYLAKVDAAEFFLSRFIDYSNKDGLFRKARIALIDGRPYPCHMAVSSNWMVHYVNAGMYEDAQKRAEEASFMEHFDDFARRHREALDAIYRLTQLDYLCIDCAESQDGKLLIFEIDHTMVVHAMDPEDLFPYKQLHMKKVQQAFRDFLIRRAAA